MQTFPCTCGNTLFFKSTACLKCGLETGMCPRCSRVTPLLARDNGQLECGNTECGAALQRCVNFTNDVTCNRGVRLDDSSAENRCDYCRLTTVVPDLSVLSNGQKWRRLEYAKQRVLFVLDSIGLPFRFDPQASRPELTFEFLADGENPVHTGHEGGRITINIREADDVEREKTRTAFHEPQRTLVGHFRHELGHYYWDCLVKNRREDDFRVLFGDDRNPSYSSALENYHTNGPGTEWRNDFVSAYATMHPWEDFAETFNAYLDMVSVLQTANHFGVTSCRLTEVDEMVKEYQRVGLLANEFNRDMGLIDLVPEVFGKTVVKKLSFVHELALPGK